MKDLPDEVWKTDDLCSRMLLSCQIKGRNETTSIEKKPKTETGIKDITGEHDCKINEEVFSFDDDIWMNELGNSLMEEEEEMEPRMENMIEGSEFETVTEDTKEESLVDVQEDQFMFGGTGGGGDALISGRRLKGITVDNRAVSDEDHVIGISKGKGMIQSSDLN